MKLRIAADSIRFRLTPEEASSLSASGKIENVLRFGPAAGQSLTYALESSAECSKMEAAFDGHLIKVVLPQKLVSDWASGTELAMERIQTAGAGTQVKIIVEKDLKLLRGTRATSC